MKTLNITILLVVALLAACDSAYYVEGGHYAPYNVHRQCSDAQFRVIRERGQPEEVEANNYSNRHVTTYYYWSQDYSVDFIWNGNRCTVKNYYHQPVY